MSRIYLAPAKPDKPGTVQVGTHADGRVYLHAQPGYAAPDDWELVYDFDAEVDDTDAGGNPIKRKAKWSDFPANEHRAAIMECRYESADKDENGKAVWKRKKMKDVPPGIAKKVEPHPPHMWFGEDL